MALATELLFKTVKVTDRVIVEAIRAVTDKPVRWVINSGGQNHRWFDNDYFQRVVGATVIASEPGLLDMKARGLHQFEGAKKTSRRLLTAPCWPTRMSPSASDKSWS